MTTVKKNRRISFFFAALLGVTLSSCASLPNDRTVQLDTDQPPQTSPDGTELKVAKKENRTGEPTAHEIENLSIEDVIRVEEPNTANLYDNSRYDFPITMNSRVESWIDYFTGRGRSHMERYLGRSSRYIPVMREILKKNDLPEDLVYLALIESGFNLRARSHARAVGAWQFMKATGKRYGLRVDSWIDERRDPLRATEAAARYLKDLYLMFESWYLAASAYNAGEYKILRAIASVKTHNYWKIAESTAIRRETKDYVPKLIAAAIIAKNPDKYGFGDVEYEEPLKYDTVTVDFPIHLRDVAAFVDVSEDEIYELNPELIQSTVPPGVDNYEIRVPVGGRVVVERAIASLKSKGPHLASLPYEHVVRPGETANTIARRYRLKVNDIFTANNLSPREKLVPGSALIIPKKNAALQVPPPAKSGTNGAPKRTVSSTRTSSEEFTVHTVRRGESLWSISEKYDVTIQDIFRWNNLKKSAIFPGKKLKVKTANRDTSQNGATYSLGTKKRARKS